MSEHRDHNISGKNLFITCDVMTNGDILNKDKKDFRLYTAILYGDKLLTAKLSKRISCAIKHLPLRVQFYYEYSTIKAIETGVKKDPTLVLENKIFIEGLIQTEEIVKRFNVLLQKEV